MNLNIKSSIDIKKILGSLGSFWQKMHTLLFFVFFIALIALGGYIWRQSLYQGAWSEQRKQDYLNSQGKGVIFNEADFKNVTADIQARKDESVQTYQSLKDIFQPYK